MKLLKIQEKVAAALGGIKAFNGVPVVVEDKGDIKARLDAAVAQASRCLLVQTPGFKATSSASKVIVGTAPVIVQAVQRIVTTAKSTAQDMAEIVAWELNLLAVEGVGTIAFREITSQLLNDQTLAYAVRFEVQTTLGDPLDNGKEEAV
ncbi:MAG: hypothetical protein IJI36_14905 [Kiritimatiellae bacterium]|nr:hypothetical protein [Kiritimatiellia bacterium]